MTQKGSKSPISGPTQAAAEERQRRSAEALRANLRRRKTQARDRAEDGDAADTGASTGASDPDEPEGR
ncbi:MAG TPA: hypothetical protein VGG27_08560 [Magnetospirillaceae bacterium]|jgi:hypothetical protein